MYGTAAHSPTSGSLSSDEPFSFEETEGLGEFVVAPSGAAGTDCQLDVFEGRIDAVRAGVITGVPHQGGEAHQQTPCILGGKESGKLLVAGEGGQHLWRQRRSLRWRHTTVWVHRTSATTGYSGHNKSLSKQGPGLLAEDAGPLLFVGETDHRSPGLR
jgi:hypothetical protein